MNEELRDLINSMETGSTENMMSAFDNVMTQKVASAIELRRQEIAGSLFGSNETEAEVETSDVADVEPESNEEEIVNSEEQEKVTENE